MVDFTTISGFDLDGGLGFSDGLSWESRVDMVYRVGTRQDNLAV